MGTRRTARMPIADSAAAIPTWEHCWPIVVLQNSERGRESSFGERPQRLPSPSWKKELVMKKVHGVLAVAALVAAVFGAPTVYTQQQAGRGGAQGGTPAQRLWWAAKAKPGQYGTNKPHIKLVDLKARHKGQANWMEVVVNDENWHAEYNQGAPGFKIQPRMRPDTREFFAVVEGQMRFTLEGQPAPIVATPTSIINIPKKTAYSVEVIGDAPALWVDANQQNYKTLYPVEG